MLFSIPVANKNQPGIYAIRNTINRKIYVGSAVHLHNRYRNHLNALLRKDHNNRLLQRFANKYGVSCLRFELIEFCAKDSLYDLEQLYLDKFLSYQRKHGYNLAKNATTSTLGLEMSEQTKKKIGEANRGRVRSQEVKDKMSVASRKRTVNTPMLGKSHSEEARKKMSVSRLGRPCSEETRKKLSAAKKGKQISEEHRNNIVLANQKRRGEKPSLLARQRMSQAQLKRRQPLQPTLFDC